MSFFESVINFFATIWQFLENIVVNTLALIRFVLTMPDILNVLNGVLPGVINTCVLLVVSIGLIKLILGWGNS